MRNVILWHRSRIQNAEEEEEEQRWTEEMICTRVSFVIAYFFKALFVIGDI